MYDSGRYDEDGNQYAFEMNSQKFILGNTNMESDNILPHTFQKFHLAKPNADTTEEYILPESVVNLSGKSSSLDAGNTEDKPAPKLRRKATIKSETGDNIQVKREIHSHSRILKQAELIKSPLLSKNAAENWNNFRFGKQRHQTLTDSQDFSSKKQAGKTLVRESRSGQNDSKARRKGFLPTQEDLVYDQKVVQDDDGIQYSRRSQNMPYKPDNSSPTEDNNILSYESKVVPLQFPCGRQGLQYRQEDLSPKQTINNLAVNPTGTPHDLSYNPLSTYEAGSTFTDLRPVQNHSAIRYAQGLPYKEEHFLPKRDEQSYIYDMAGIQHPEVPMEYSQITNTLKTDGDFVVQDYSWQGLEVNQDIVKAQSKMDTGGVAIVRRPRALMMERIPGVRSKVQAGSSLQSKSLESGVWKLYDFSNFIYVLEF